MSLKQLARNLRRKQTDEEKDLWRALRSRRFAGFRFRRQYIAGEHILDFYCAAAKLAIELDGFQHGTPEGALRDEVREKYLMLEGILIKRFWNHQWRKKGRVSAGDLEPGSKSDRLRASYEGRRRTTICPS